MNQNTFRPSENYGQKLNKPSDLVSIKQIIHNPAYKHVHMSRNKLKSLEEKELINTFTNSIGTKFVSLSQLESVLSNYIPSTEFLKNTECTPDNPYTKLTSSFLDYAIKKGVENIKRGKETLINKISIENFINTLQAKSHPLDLVSFNQIKTDPEYTHIKMSHEKLNNLEKRDHITTFKASPTGTNYVSISQLESIVKIMLDEEKTVITINSLETSEQYKPLNLYWGKVQKLIEDGELEFKETISGKKAVTISSVDDYIKKINSSKETKKYTSINKILTVYKKKWESFKEGLTPAFIDYALNNGVEYIKKGKHTLIDLDGLKEFIEQFNIEWISKNEAHLLLNVRKEYLYERQIKLGIPTLRFGLYIYYPRTFIDSELKLLNQKRKKLEEKAKYENKESIQHLGVRISLDNALSFLRNNGIPIKTNDDLLSLSSILNLDIFNDKKKRRKMLYRLQIKKISDEYTPFIYTEDEIKNYCTENNIRLVWLNDSNVNIIRKESSKSLLTHFYYSRKETKSLLSADEHLFKKIKQQYIAKDKIITLINGTQYFLKNIIDNLIIQQKNLLLEWMGSKEACERISYPILQHYSNRQKRIKTLKAPVLVRPLLSGRILYYRQDVINVSIEDERNKQLNSLDISNPVEIFEVIFKQIYNLKFDSVASKTEEIWFRYVKKKLNKSNLDEQHTKSFIKQLVSCTELLINATSELGKEVFSFYSNDINKFLLGPKEIPKTHKRIFTDFFTELYTNLQELARDAGKKIFNKDNLLKSHLKPSYKREKSIYKFEDYLAFYHYANDIKLHKMKAINDVISNIKGLPCARYDSMWLFLIVNMNNPWNHNDILNFPRIDLSMTKISSLEWLEHNDIDYQDAKSIYGQMREWDSRREKSGIQQNFHISSQLKLAFATAASICELRRQNESLVHTKLIDFKTTAQKLKYSHKPYVEFFRNFERDLKYENLKMARSIISFKNVVLSEYTEPEDQSIKYERGHSKLETTNIYVQIPQEHLDFLCKQIFSRGYFGNIYYHLSEIFYGKTKDRTEQTKRIVSLKDRIGDILKIEGIASVINSLSTERDIVSQTIDEMEISSANSLFKKLSCNAMPAKEKNFQCLNYPKGCLYKGRSCASCPISVGNYLAVMKIANNLMSSLYKISHSFNTANTHDKIVMANHLHKNLIDFAACRSQFTDKDINEIYHLLSIDRDDFLTFTAKLPEYQEYVSYEPR